MKISSASSSFSAKSLQFDPQVQLSDIKTKPKALKLRIENRVSEVRAHEPKDTIKIKVDIQEPKEPSEVKVLEIEIPAKDSVMKRREEAELFSKFMETMLATMTREEAVSILGLAQQKAAECQEIETEPFVAALVLRSGVKKLKSLYPGASKKKIRMKAKANPELAQNLRLADSAEAYLKAHKARRELDTISGTPSKTAKPESKKVKNPVSERAEKQAKRLAEHHQTLNTIAETIAQMAQERRESIEKIAEMTRETNRSISDMRMESWSNRQASMNKHFQAFLSLISGKQ